jgi:hypothetical protein
MEATQIQGSIDIARPHVTGSERGWARKLFVGFGVLFVLGVLAQVFLAGAAIFDDWSWFQVHEIVGHLLVHPLPLLPLLMLIFSFVGRLPRADKWLSGLLVLLAVVQPIFIYVGRGQHLPLLAALHPVNAMLLLLVPVLLIMRARQ